jgi:hypothetical protein
MPRRNALTFSLAVAGFAMVGSLIGWSLGFVEVLISRLLKRTIESADRLGRGSELLGGRGGLRDKWRAFPEPPQ